MGSTPPAASITRARSGHTPGKHVTCTLGTRVVTAHVNTHMAPYCPGPTTAVVKDVVARQAKRQPKRTRVNARRAEKGVKRTPQRG